MPCRMFRLAQGGVSASIVSLTAGALGTGILSLPYALKLCGWGLGTGILIADSIFAAFSIYVLMMGIVKTSARTYAQLIGFVSHPYVTPIVDCVIAFYGMGSILTYFIMMGDFWGSLLLLFPACPEWLSHRVVLITIGFAITLPLSLPRKLNTVRYGSLLPLLAIFVLAVVVMIRTPMCIDKWAHQRAQGEGDPLPPAAIWSFDILTANNLFVFAFMQHLQVCLVADEMKAPTERKLVQTAFIALAMETVLYLPVTVLGYFSFRSGTEQNLTQNFPANDPAMISCRVLLSLGLIIAIPLNAIATAKSIKHFLRRIAGVPLADDEVRLTGDDDSLQVQGESFASAPQDVFLMTHTAHSRIMLAREAASMDRHEAGERTKASGPAAGQSTSRTHKSAGTTQNGMAAEGLQTPFLLGQALKEGDETEGNAESLQTLRVSATSGEEIVPPPAGPDGVPPDELGPPLLERSQTIRRPLSHSLLQQHANSLRRIELERAAQVTGGTGAQWGEGGEGAGLNSHSQVGSLLVTGGMEDGTSGEFVSRQQAPRASDASSTASDFAALFDSWHFHVLTVSVSVGAPFGISLGVDKLAASINLISGLFATTLMMLFPFLVYLKLLRPSRSFVVHILSASIFMLWIVVGYASTITFGLSSMHLLPSMMMQDDHYFRSDEEETHNHVQNGEEAAETHKFL